MPGPIQRAYGRTTLTPYFVRHITSWLLPPLALAVIRALFSLYIFATLFVTFGIQIASGESRAAANSFSYFTNLTWWGLGFYFAVSAGHGLSYYRRGGIGLSRDTAEHGGLRWAHGAFYATVTVFPLIVTGVFWGLLAKGALFNPVSTWYNISEHAVNTGFALFEVLVPSTEATPWVHVLPMIILLALYLALTYISHNNTGTYVYPFLDVAKQGAGITAAYIAGILVVAVIIFAIVHFIIMFRRWVTETKMGLTGKMPDQSGSRTESEDVEQVAVTVEKNVPAPAPVDYRNMIHAPNWQR